MAATIIRPLGYTNSLQQLVWDGNNGTPVTAYLWGAGGGGGGNDSGPGGNGSGGGYAQINFTINNGDVLQVAVGGKGTAGASGLGNAPGGNGGASYLFVTGGYYGGPGGSSGPVGSSGGGGGGGGATVVILNGSVIAVAGGGGGGGGGGNTGVVTGDNAPGNQGQSGSLKNGGAGTIKTGDGGGGGGGGGGYYGGLGGGVRSGDQGAYAGAYGLSLGTITAQSFNQTPANQSNPYYAGTAGIGGGRTSPGTAGYAVFEFTISGGYVHDGAGFQPVDKTYVKANGIWNPVETTWIKNAGEWYPIVGSYAPAFTKISGNFGVPGRICMSVIDECSQSASTIQNNWNSFISQYSETPLYLLQPGGPGQGSLKIPYNFNSTTGVGPIAVNRDNGSSSAISDWFALCGLSVYPAGTIVQIAIDNSGSMTFDTVSASYNYFLTRCATAGFTVETRTMSNENWVTPFIGGNTSEGGKIICTKLWELGILSEDVYAADQKFGAELLDKHPDIYNGYRAWAEIVVEWMNGAGPNMMPWMNEEKRRHYSSSWSTHWAEDIATPWAEEMAYRMGVKEQGSITGRWLMTAGIPICMVIGVVKRRFGPRKTKPGFVTGLGLIGIFVFFKLIVEFGRLIEKYVKR